jgi:hypothetical protein
LDKVAGENNMKFIITVDTEADNVWRHYEELAFNNIRQVPLFQSLCEQHGFPPTYLLTYRAALDEYAAKLFRAYAQSGRAEIGAHFHPWPSGDMSGKKQSSREHSYPTELADDILREKLEILTKTIADRVGVRPASYRAGRWGFDDRQAAILSGLGYRVDCSVTPKVDWRNNFGDLDSAGGPDFRACSAYPYFLNGQLLEVPMTILFTGVFKQERSLAGKIFLKMPSGFISHAVNRLFFRKTWLRIFPGSNLNDWQRIYRSADANKLPMVQFMIHSSELMPGGSPYSRSESDVEHIFTQLEEMFKYFKDLGLEGATLSQFAKEFKS